MNEHKKLALEALERMKGDDLIRARSAFRGLSPEQMKQEYGQSGKTRNEIIAEYEAYDKRIDAAIAWVESQT